VSSFDKRLFESNLQPQNIREVFTVAHSSKEVIPIRERVTGARLHPQATPSITGSYTTLAHGLMQGGIHSCAYRAGQKGAENERPNT
jgi:hypothetical protein